MNDTDVCNQALAAIGTRSTITSMEEKSAEARACRLQFVGIRQQVLRAAHWGFARRYAQLSLLKAALGTPEHPTSPGVPVGSWDSKTQPPPPWAYEYAYPPDCILVRYLMRTEENSPTPVPIFSVMPMGGHNAWMGPPIKFVKALDIIDAVSRIVLLTNQSQASVCYTADVADLALWDAAAAQALVQGLAAQLAIALTGDKKIYQDMVGTANALLMEARAADANEDLTVMDHTPDWLRVRGVGPGNVWGPWLPDYGPLFG